MVLENPYISGVGQLANGTYNWDSHAVNCHINRLRAKIEPNPSEPQYLLTAWGVGYKFTTEPTVAG